MGRRKVEIKRIEDKASRQVTFSKRRSGLIKKAKDLSLLCDIEVALVVFSSRERLYEFCSSNRLSDVLERYQKSSEADGQASTHYMEADHCTSIQASTELIHTVQRGLNGPNSNEVNIAQLMQMHKQLDVALANIRTKKFQLMIESTVSLQEQEKLLKEENELLEKQIGEMERQNCSRVTFHNLAVGSIRHPVNRETLPLLRD